MSKAGQTELNSATQHTSYPCAAACSRARRSGSLSPRSPGAECPQGPAMHTSQPSCTCKRHHRPACDSAYRPVRRNGCWSQGACPPEVRHGRAAGPSALCAEQPRLQPRLVRALVLRPGLLQAQAHTSSRHGCRTSVGPASRANCASQQGQAARPAERIVYSSKSSSVRAHDSP